VLSTSLARRAVAIAVAGIGAVTGSASPGGALAAADDPPLPPDTHFFVPAPGSDALGQVADLARARDPDAHRLALEETTPQAVWLTKGTPTEVEATVRRTVAIAAGKHTVPVLVLYDVPARDCSQYSAGGAADDDAYRAWADGVARGLESGRRAVVIVEPDGLGLLPSTCPGTSAEGRTAPLTDAGRYADLHYAGAAVLRADPQALVYLDAGHSNWMSVGDAATRLHEAGVEDFRGFALNTANYQWTPNLEHYGTWIAQCLAYGSGRSDFGACPNQYWNGGPSTEWRGGAMDPYLKWAPDAADAGATTRGIGERYAALLGDAAATAHFVIDTSRNGRGPWDWAAAGLPSAATAQDWCDPPGRGLGSPPKADPDPAFPLLDAFLWVKTPGQSDGQCDRQGGTTPGSPDREWGGVDPAGGTWFPQQALELARLADPPLR
jgi:endoglucanase